MITRYLECPWHDYCIICSFSWWRYWRWFRKITVRFQPIRKEIVSSVNNNESIFCFSLGSSGKNWYSTAYKFRNCSLEWKLVYAFLATGHQFCYWAETPWSMWAVLLADPPSYDGGAAISGYVMEMENPVTKGQNATFVLYVAVRVKILIKELIRCFFLPSRSNMTKFQFDPGMHGHFWTSSCELHGAPWVNKLHIIYFFISYLNVANLRK